MGGYHRINRGELKRRGGFGTGRGSVGVIVPGLRLTNQGCGSGACMTAFRDSKWASAKREEFIHRKNYIFVRQCYIHPVFIVFEY